MLRTWRPATARRRFIPSTGAGPGDPLAMGSALGFLPSGEEEGTLRLRLEGSARYGTVDYLLRNVGGRLQGFIVYNPAPGNRGRSRAIAG